MTGWSSFPKKVRLKGWHDKETLEGFATKLWHGIESTNRLCGTLPRPLERSHQNRFPPRSLCGGGKSSRRLTPARLLIDGEKGFMVLCHEQLKIAVDEFQQQSGVTFVRPFCEVSGSETFPLLLAFGQGPEFCLVSFTSSSAIHVPEQYCDSCYKACFVSSCWHCNTVFQLELYVLIKMQFQAHFWYHNVI